MNIRELLIEHLIEVLKDALIKEEPTILSEIQALTAKLQKIVKDKYPESGTLINFVMSAMQEPSKDKPKC